jgi:hypothetical protein
MNTKNLKYDSGSQLKLGIYWWRRTLTLGEYSTQLKQYLRTLREFHPIFTNIYEVGDRPNAVIPVNPDDEASFRQFIFERAFSKDMPPYKQLHLDADGKPTLATTGLFGFSTSFINQPKENAKTLPSKISFSIAAGGSGASPNNVLVRFPRESPPEFEDIDFVKRLFALMIKSWRPESGWFYTSEISEKLPRISDEDNRLGLMNYSWDPRIKAVLPADVTTEPFGDNGFLFSLIDDLAQRNDPAVIEKGLRVRDILHKNGLYKRDNTDTSSSLKMYRQ